MKLDLEMQQEIDALYRGSLPYVERVKQAEYNALKASHDIGIMLVKKRLEVDPKGRRIRKFLLEASTIFEMSLSFLNYCMLFAAKCPDFEEFWKTYTKGKYPEFCDVDYIVSVVLRNVPSKLEYWKKEMIAEKTCLFCGNSLAGKPFDAKFCSAKCRKKFHKRKTKAPV